MHTVKKISPLYNKPDMIEDLGQGNTVGEAIEVLRKYFLECNQRLLDLGETMDVPECITTLAQSAVDRNHELDIVVNEQGVVFVDGNGPEMDYYTITE